MKFGGFWNKVENYLNEAKEQDWHQRFARSLSHRWSNIQQEVNKFSGCLSQIERMHRGGVSKEDKEPADAREDDHDLNEIDNNERPIRRKDAKDKRKLSKEGIKDYAVISNAISKLKAQKKKDHDDRMLNYNSSIEQREKLLELRKAQFEIQKAQF